MASTSSRIVVKHSSFKDIIGPNPSISLCTESSDGAPIFHEACVYLSSTSSLFVTSNIIQNGAGEKQIVVSKVDVSNPSTYEVETADTGLVMANGGVNYQDGILFCEQGNMSRSSGLVYVRPNSNGTYARQHIVDEFDGVPFSSLNDVVIAKDGAIWFTDPPYGHEQGFRPPPQLPAMVYRLDPANGEVRAMADGFGRPNGLAFSPDESVLYVTDTDHIHGDGSRDPTRASTIYAFTISPATPADPSPILTSRRVFAFATSRCPDGIKCDTNGNVYSGCLDGISVWNPAGALLGKILVPGGVANFCFARPGEIFACGETRLWRIELNKGIIGALLGVV